jgi:hypothetical protein
LDSFIVLSGKRKPVITDYFSDFCVVALSMLELPCRFAAGYPGVAQNGFSDPLRTGIVVQEFACETVEAVPPAGVEGSFAFSHIKLLCLRCLQFR